VFDWKTPQESTNVEPTQIRESDLQELFNKPTQVMSLFRTPTPRYRQHARAFRERVQKRSDRLKWRATSKPDPAPSAKFTDELMECSVVALPPEYVLQ
jgi:hypothetical protein